MGLTVFTTSNYGGRRNNAGFALVSSIGAPALPPGTTQELTGEGGCRLHRRRPLCRGTRNEAGRKCGTVRARVQTPVLPNDQTRTSKADLRLWDTETDRTKHRGDISEKGRAQVRRINGVLPTMGTLYPNYGSSPFAKIGRPTPIRLNSPVVVAFFDP
jgi:hypothetical protein